jgi:hypothetical protein
MSRLKDIVDADRRQQPSRARLFREGSAGQSHRTVREPRGSLSAASWLIGYVQERLWTTACGTKGFCAVELT